MSYKSGETPQQNDEVLGQVDGMPARGRVLAVRENGDILLTRRAPYMGKTEPLSSEHHEVPAAEFSLVYRSPSSKPAPAAAPKASKKAAKAGAAAK